MEIHITNQQVSDFLKKQALIKGINDFEFSYLVDTVEKCAFGPGELIFPEGDLSNDLYFIYEGEVSSLKTDSQTGKEFTLGVFKTGDFFGDLAFLDNEPHSSGMKALANTVLLKLSKETSYSQSSEMTHICNKITANIAKITIRRLRNMNESVVQNTIQESEKLLHLLALSKLLIFAVLLNWAAGMMIGRIETPSMQKFVQSFIIAGILFYVIRRYYGTFTEFGLPFNRWKLGLQWGTLISLGLIMITALFYGISDFVKSVQFNVKTPHFIALKWDTALFFYPICVFLKEFVSRGVIQNSFKRLFIDKTALFEGNKSFLTQNNSRKAILVTSLILALAVLPFGLRWFFLFFIVNLFLGFIYDRMDDLLGITLVHMTLGIVLVIMSVVPQLWLMAV